MTTFAHIGDFHAHQDARNGDRYAALDQILRECCQLDDLAAWLWPGDLNDARMSIEDRNALAARLTIMADCAPVVLCYGNHDLPGDLDVFARLKAKFPIYVVDAGVRRIRLATGRELASIFVLPYPNKAALVAAGIAKHDVGGTGADLLESVFIVAADELARNRAEGDYTLMIGHVNVAGAIASTGQPNIGHEIELSPRHLDRLGDIPKLLNHIHKAQTIAGADYAGSVCRLNWGEIEDKSYLLLHYDKVDKFWIERPPVDVPKMYHVEGALTREGFTIPAVNDMRDPTVFYRGGDVRVRVRFRQSEKAALNFDLVRAPFANARVLVVEPIAVPDRELRAPDVVAAGTTLDKLQAYAKRPLTERERQKFDALEHGCHMTLLDGVNKLIAGEDEATPTPAPAEAAAVL